MNKKLAGYSFIELTVVIAIITVLAILTFPVTITELQKTRLKGTVADIASHLYQFQQNAFAMKNNKSYGLAFNQAQEKYIFYIGPNLATAEETDEIVLQNNITLVNINLSGGQTEITFTAGSFRPSVSGNVLFSDGSNSFSLYINGEGLIDYY